MWSNDGSRGDGSRGDSSRGDGSRGDGSIGRERGSGWNYGGHKSGVPCNMGGEGNLTNIKKPRYSYWNDGNDGNVFKQIQEFVNVSKMSNNSTIKKLKAF